MDNKQKISDCALKLFARRGYDAAGVQEIIDDAGITKPTLYHYFGSKEGLLKAVLKEHFDMLHNYVEKAAVYDGDITNTLEKIILAFFGFAKNNRDCYRMQLSMWFAPAESVSNKLVAGHNNRIFKLVEKAFESASKDHGNMKGKHSLYAAAFIGLINTYIGLYFNGYTELDGKFARTVLHQFMHGIFS